MPAASKNTTTPDQPPRTTEPPPSPAGELTKTIIRSLRESGGFTLPSFGTFTVKKTKPRKTLNPRTGKPAKPKPGTTIEFKPSPNLEKAISASDGVAANHSSRANAKMPEIALSAFTPGPRARALLNGIKIAEDDLKAAGGAFDLSEVQTLMHGISRQRIEQRVREKALLAIPGPSNRRRYPAFQFNADGTLIDGLQQIQETLNVSSPWSVLNFLISPDDRLNNERPIDLLRRGDLPAVLDSAKRIGHQGA